jgi:hypothetical protein
MYLREMPDLHYLFQECKRAGFLSGQKEVHVHFRAEVLRLSYLPAHPGVWAEAYLILHNGSFRKPSAMNMLYGEQKFPDHSFVFFQRYSRALL